MIEKFLSWKSWWLVLGKDRPNSFFVIFEKCLFHEFDKTLYNMEGTLVLTKILRYYRPTEIKKTRNKNNTFIIHNSSQFL